MTRLLWLVGCWISVCAGWGAFAVVAPDTVAPDTGDFEASRGAARRVLVGELLELAEQAGEQKLFLSREGYLKEVLGLAPDNESARAALGHKRQKDGSWRAPERRNPPRDHAPEQLAEFRRRHAAAGVKYGHAVLAAMERAQPPLQHARRDELRSELLALAPDDAKLRAAFGEARAGADWVLLETVAAKARRPVLKDIVRAAYESVEPAREVAPNEREQAVGLAWTAVLETPAARVLGTAPRDELETVARVLQAARASFNGLFGTEVGYYPGGSVFVLAKEGDKERFLATHPAIDADYRAFLTRLEGSGIQGSHDMAHWSQDPRQRLDGIVRIALGWLSRQAFGISTDVGWIYEGVGLYITRELIGTRLTWFIQASSEYLAPNEEAMLRRRLMRDDTNWMNEANQVLQGEKPPRLPFVMGKTVNNMSPEDMLYAYVVVAYMLEARAEEAPVLFARVGRPVASTQAVADVLGFDVPDLDRRVRRWLTERR